MNEFEMPNKDASLRGDNKAMPNRGSSTGVTDTYGADLGPNATNRKGSIASATKSDAMFKDTPHSSPTV